VQDIVDIICVKYLWMLISVSTIHKEKIYVSWALPLRRIRRGIGMQNTQAGYPRIRTHET